MLIPVLVKINRKVTTATTLVLENLVGSNLPLLFPELTVYNRTPTSCSVTISGVTKTLYTGEVDPDFNGLVSTATFTTFSVGNGSSARPLGFGYELVPSAYGITHEVTLANAGPAAEARLSLILTGMIESSVSPDPLAVVNV